MKKKILLAVIPLLATALLGVGENIPDISMYQNGLISETFGPFQKGDDYGDYEVTLTANPSIRNKTICIKTHYYDYTFTNHLGVNEQLHKKVLVPKTIYIPSNIKIMMNDEGIGYLIEYWNYTDEKLLLEYRIPLKASNRKDLCINDLSSFNNGYTFRLNKQEVILNDYDIICNNFTDYLYNDKYYKLNLSQFYFNIEHPEEMTFDSAYMIILNPDRNFPLLVKDKNGTITLKIKFEENNGDFHIVFDETLYVVPETLYMSTFPYKGSRLTNNFYFPINQQRYIDGTRFRFVINGLGSLKSDIYWNVRFSIGSNLIGECYNSDYCIGSGVKI